MSTCPIPCLESSPTPSHMPKPNVRKIQFSKQKFFVLENIIPSFGKIYWTTLRGELLGNSLKQSWISFRDEPLDNSPRQFFGKSSLKFLSQSFSFFFHFFFMSCTHTYHSRVLQCIWNALCHFQTIHANIFYMHILTKINSHTSCYSIHGDNIKISSHGLITIQTIHFESPKKHKNSHTTHVNSRTLGSALFTVTQ